MGEEKGKDTTGSQSMGEGVWGRKKRSGGKGVCVWEGFLDELFCAVEAATTCIVYFFPSNEGSAH